MSAQLCSNMETNAQVNSLVLRPFAQVTTIHCLLTYSASQNHGQNAGETTNSVNHLTDTRAQPWKKFVTVPTETKVVTFGKDETIRMIASRVDGKSLGG